MKRQKKIFENKIVVVTGAGAGIGRAICEAFAEEGAHLAIISRDVYRLNSLKEQLEKRKTKVLVLPLDVADADAVYNASLAVISEFGTIDIWINNAMTSVFSPVMEMTAGEYRRVTEVTYLGVVRKR